MVTALAVELHWRRGDGAGASERARAVRAAEAVGLARLLLHAQDRADEQRDRGEQHQVEPDALVEAAGVLDQERQHHDRRLEPEHQVDLRPA